MEQYHEIVMRETIQQHKDTRLLAMNIRNKINLARQAAHNPEDGDPPPEINHVHPDVMEEVYRELRDNGAAYPTSVAKYDEKAKQYEKNA